MIDLGLTAADRVLYEKALCSSHETKVSVQILDLNHNYISDISAVLEDGQVNIDGDADITRSATLTLFDPDRSMGLDSNSPSDGALGLDRMIRIVYSIESDLLPKRIDCPLFCGPITNLSRTDDLLNIECQGKEVLAMVPTWFSQTYEKGYNKVDLIKKIMTDKRGETKFTLAALNATTPASIALGRETVIWSAVKGLAKGYHLFYDGRGVLRLRAVPNTNIFTFKTGDDGQVMSYPDVSYDLGSVKNTVLVVGAVPKGKTTPITAISTAPKDHPLSTYSLGSNGRQRILLDKIEDSTISSVSEAKKVADARLKSLLIQNVQIQFECVIYPHVEPEDVYHVNTPEFSQYGRIKQISIPLKGTSMTVGYNARVSANKANIRKKK